jgi:selenide,water dikinase
MQTTDQPILRDIVLVGGGHSHVVVVKAFAMQPMAGVRLTVICTDTETPYSGMLPGYVAGHYLYDDVHIDLGRLCALAGARFIQAEVGSIDRSQKQVICQGRPPIDYDLLSINIGATPQTLQVPGAAEFAVPVKPIARFNQRWLALLARYESNPQGKLRIAVVGAGAGGVELLLAMQHRMPQAQLTLFTDSAQVLPTHSPSISARFAAVLAQRNVTVHVDAPVTKLGAGQLQAKGQTFTFDEMIWVTGAGGAPWLLGTGLALDAKGCIRVNESLQSTTDASIFAAGDVASFPQPLEKAGVFAVRQGMPLAANLRRHLLGQPLRAYRPQRSWLALISTGDQRVIASRGAIWAMLAGFGLGGDNVSGKWLWRWKDWIDQRFMRKFNVQQDDFAAMQASSQDRSNQRWSPAFFFDKLSKLIFRSQRQLVAENFQLTSEESLQAISALAMRCGGCGAKVGATVLSRALGALTPIERSDVLIGLHAPDDAAVVRVPTGQAMVHTVDFFRAFVDDPFVFGKIAAQHALGDIFAMGGQAQSATAIATVPPGLERKVEATLRDMMAGAVEVLNAAGCALVGGHTGEGKELALGFAINGLVGIAPDGVTLPRTMTKGAMQAGDVLILTKPIGTGTLFAALPKGVAKGRWIQAALVSMQQSNQQAAQCLLAHGATACTDLTGFGLLGHLVEMTKPSGVDAELNLAALPLLDGAQACIAAGVTSSLQAANVRLRRAIKNQADFAQHGAIHPRYPLIFDPQTAGGLLASVPPSAADQCVQALINLGYSRSAIIGRVLPIGDTGAAIQLVDNAG